MPKTNLLLWLVLSVMLFTAQWYVHNMDDLVALLTGKAIAQAAQLEMIVASAVFFLLAGWLLHYAILLIASWFKQGK